LIKTTAEVVPPRFKTSIDPLNSGEAFVRVPQVDRALEEAERGRKTISGI
jgi:hypothetical protein